MSKFLVLMLTFAIKNISNSFAAEENVLDMRRFCFDTASRNLLLPSYSGRIGAYVVQLSSKSVREGSCNLNFSTSSEDFRLILVMEFQEHFRCNENQIFVQDDSVTLRDVCATTPPTSSIYPHGRTSKTFSLVFLTTSENSSDWDFRVIVSTASRIPSGKFGSCEDLGKISCGMDEDWICVDGDVQCDDRPNCGERGKFDEDVDVCRVTSKKIWYIILLTVALLTFCSFLFYRLVDKLLKPLEGLYFVLEDDEGKDRLKVEPQRKPPRVKTFEEDVSKKDSFEIVSLSENKSEKETSLSEVKAEEGFVADSLRSSTETTTTISEEKPRKTKKRGWPDISKTGIPQYERRLSDRMKTRMLSSASEEDKPKITFYGAMAKLS